LARLQIEAEFKRFSKFIEPEVRIANYVGGISRKLNEDELKDKETRPHIVIGTPGRLKDLAESGKLPLGDIKYFIVDECDKILDQLGAF
jgi:ATP-dependent RNA helicase UAP56/SUB2